MSQLNNMNFGKFDADGPPKWNVNGGRASADEIDQSLNVELGQGRIVGKGHHHVSDEPVIGDGGLEVSGDGGEYIDWDAIDALLETA